MLLAAAVTSPVLKHYQNYCTSSHLIPVTMPAEPWVGRLSTNHSSSSFFGDFIWENKSSLFLSLIIEEQMVPVLSHSLSGLNNCCRTGPSQQRRALIGKAGSRFSLSDCVVRQWKVLYNAMHQIFFYYKFMLILEIINDFIHSGTKIYCHFS